MDELLHPGVCDNVGQTPDIHSNTWTRAPRMGLNSAIRQAVCKGLFCSTVGSGQVWVKKLVVSATQDGQYENWTISFRGLVPSYSFYNLWFFFTALMENWSKYLWECLLIPLPIPHSILLLSHKSIYCKYDLCWQAMVIPRRFSIGSPPAFVRVFYDAY